MAPTESTSESYLHNLPLTPRESDNEDLTNLTPMAGRKRNASEMEDDGDKSTASKVAEGTSETIEAEISSDFTVECPARPRRTKSPIPEDVYYETAAPSLAPNLSVNFAVRPGDKWARFSRYRNAKFKDPLLLVYSAGQIVYVNRQDPLPPPLPADASEDEKLQYDKENLWAGLISEFRAESQEKVYVRVFWFYWPEELPMGRQPYHGKRELILSNHVGIIEAQCISSHADISQWDENDDSNKIILSERYWRQTLDVKKLAKDRDHALSKLRRFCICGGYDNPSMDMYQCRKVGCGLWNHEQCLIKAIEERAWAKFKKGTLTHEIQERDEGKGFAQKVGETVSNLAHRAFGKDGLGAEAMVIVKGNKKRKGVPTGKHVWAGKLQGAIHKTKTVDGSDAHYATVTQLVPTSGSAEFPSGFEPKTWQMKMSCLKCGEPLN
ncbi:hypothetical protein PV08_00655 [Exophiala spinifera]|uniref:BAH domain-containing protein n=1 Tax=Exophiala spinifera TaxID=91928 RepID=A0A0D2BNH4_9EURO|nr:uncharacterized protein PV08_00655 [Exophiala spinifera]KIW20080.1 hypothetical protein PV08_00655 [Exophiala spinifera]